MIYQELPDEKIAGLKEAMISDQQLEESYDDLNDLRNELDDFIIPAPQRVVDRIMDYARS
jgi:hypothetical protein